MNLVPIMLCSKCVPQYQCHLKILCYCKIPCHNKAKLQFILLCWLVGISSFSDLVFATERLVLNTALTTPLTNESQNGFVDVIVGDALERIGYELKSVKLPAERALINANAGIDDGDLLRIGGLQKIYPNLIQVPEPIIDLEFVVFTKHITSLIDNWQSLNRYSVSIITGWKILERNITHAAELTKVKNVNQLFTMLQKDRVDAIVYSRWAGLGYINQHRMTGIRMLEPPLDRSSMYVYLHKKHQQLVPKLTAALRALKADGSYQRAYLRILLPLTGG